MDFYIYLFDNRAAKQWISGFTSPAKPTGSSIRKSRGAEEPRSRGAAIAATSSAKRKVRRVPRSGKCDEFRTSLRQPRGRINTTAPDDDFIIQSNPVFRTRFSEKLIKIISSGIKIDCTRPVNSEFPEHISDKLSKRKVILPFNISVYDSHFFQFSTRYIQRERLKLKKMLCHLLFYF
jgi:hypothetical protein